MHFRDEFYYDYENINYFVEVEGFNYIDDFGMSCIEVKAISIYDEQGEPIELDHPHYKTIKEEAEYRDYEVELENNSLD